MLWAENFGRRLKFLHASAAAEPRESRQAGLETELRSALLELPAEQRAIHLEALAERFPSWELATTLTYAAPVNPPTSDEVVKAFFEHLPRLSAEQMKDIRQRLAAAGLAGASKPLEGEALAEVQTRLKLDPNEAIDAQRLGKLFAALTEVMLTLDQLVWNLWRTAAPKSASRRDPTRGDLRTLMRRSLVGDAEASAAQVQQQLEATRQLIAGLLASLGSAGRSFALRYQSRFSPEAIQTAVRADGGGGLFANAEVKCWKKYTELAAEITDDSIEDDIRDAVVKFAEDLMRGSHR